MKRINRIKPYTKNPIIVNIIFAIGFVAATVATFSVMFTVGYFTGLINICFNLLVYCPILMLFGLFVRYDNFKQLVLDIVPITIIISVLIIVSSFTTVFEAEMGPSFVDYLRMVFFPVTCIAGAQHDTWKTLVVPFLLLNLLTPVSFILPSTIMYFIHSKKNKN